MADFIKALDGIMDICMQKIHKAAVMEAVLKLSNKVFVEMLILQIPFLDGTPQRVTVDFAAEVSS